MDLVVVYLNDIGKHVIVPEKYVHDLNVPQLKNRGRNTCRDFLVYYTDDCIECEYYPDPISEAIVLKEFPAGRGGWFYGRTIFFTGKVIQFIQYIFFLCTFLLCIRYALVDDATEAKKVKENRRNLLPPVYNSARLKEKPIPSLELASHDDADGTQNASITSMSQHDSDANDGDPLEISALSLNAASTARLNDEPISSLELAAHDDANETQNASITSMSQHDSNANDVDPLSTSALSSNAASTSTSTSTSAVQQEFVFKQEPIFEQMGDRDANAAEILLNNSYEQCGSDDDVFIHKDDFLPAPVGSKASYQMKKNDVVTGKKPFAIHVSVCVAYGSILYGGFSNEPFSILISNIRPKQVRVLILCSTEIIGSQSHFQPASLMDYLH